jgi:hypothetical protein
MTINTAARSCLLAAALLCPIVARTSLPNAASRAAPVVVELFTSQSCSSCPPADAILRELARRPNVLALDLHVDYWDGPGWRDPFASAAFTRRQREYASLLGNHEVYTPELVVGGHTGVVGSDREAVEAALAAAASDPQVPLSLHHDGTNLVAEAADGRGTATLWLAGYDSRRETRIGGGENGGRTLVEADVVRSLAPVAAWSGARLRTTVAPPAGERAAVFLQAADGRIIGAAIL